MQSNKTNERKNNELLLCSNCCIYSNITKFMCTYMYYFQYNAASNSIASLRCYSLCRESMPRVCHTKLL